MPSVPNSVASCRLSMTPIREALTYRQTGTAAGPKRGGFWPIGTRAYPLVGPVDRGDPRPRHPAVGEFVLAWQESPVHDSSVKVLPSLAGGGISSLREPAAEYLQSCCILNDSQ